MISRQRQEQLRNPEKLKARQAVGRALRTGRLVQSIYCQECNATGIPIVAHHNLGYERDHWLDVVFLCRVCHRLKHAQAKPPKPQQSQGAGLSPQEMQRRAWLSRQSKYSPDTLRQQLADQGRKGGRAGKGKPKRPRLPKSP